MTFVARDTGPAYALVPKVASMTLREAVAGRKISNEEALQRAERIMFVRDPFDRLGSAYSFLTGLHERHANIIPPMPKWASYEEFVEWALVSDDGHVVPQVDHVTTVDGVFVPTVMLPIEAVKQVFPSANRLHESQRKPVTNYREADIRLRYAKDFDLCQRL